MLSSAVPGQVKFLSTAAVMFLVMSSVGQDTSTSLYGLEAAPLCAPRIEAGLLMGKCPFPSFSLLGK